MELTVRHVGLCIRDYPTRVIGGWMVQLLMVQNYEPKKQQEILKVIAEDMELLAQLFFKETRRNIIR